MASADSAHFSMLWAELRMMVQPLPIGFSVYLPKGLISHCGLNLQSLSNDIEHRFMCLFAICTSSSVVGLFMFLVHFLMQLFLLLCTESWLFYFLRDEFCANILSLFVNFSNYFLLKGNCFTEFCCFCQTSTWITHRVTYIPALLNLPPISLPI